MPRKKAAEALPPEEQPDALTPDTPSDAPGSDTPDVPDSVQPEMLEITPEFPAALPEASESPPEEETVSDTSADSPEQAVEPPVSLAQDFPDDSDHPFDEDIEPPADSSSEASILLTDASNGDSFGSEEAADDQGEAPAHSSEKPPSTVSEENPPAKPRRTSRRRTAATEPSPLQPASRQVPPNTVSGILSIDAKAEVETEEYREDTIWHEIRNAYRTRRILTGTLGGVEQADDGKSLVIVEYKGFRVVIPAKEMMLSLDRRPSGNDYTALMRRHNQILSAMMGAEIDFIVRGIDNKTRSIVASRKEAMLRKRQTFYLDQDASGEYRITPGRLVQARVTAVSEKVIRVEAFGLECAILARDLAWDWMGDARDRYSVGDRIVVRILDVQRNGLEDITIRADVKSVSSTTDQDNLKKCRVQGKYAGKVTDVHKGVVFVRLTNGVNAIAHACLDRRMPGKKDDVSFVVTHIDPEQCVAFGIITRIIKQNL